MGHRVLFLTHRLNVGGAAVQMAKLGRALTERGHAVAAAARDFDTGEAYGEAFFRDHGFELHKVDFPAYGASLRNLRALLRSRRRLRDAAEAFRPDLLHVHAPTLCLPAKLARLDLPTASTFHIEVVGASKTRLARLAVRLSDRAFGERVCCISSEMKQWLTDVAGLPERRLELVYNGVDPDAFPPPTPEQRAAARQRWDLPDEALVLCIAASLEERKNHRLLLEALARVGESSTPIQLLCAGTGPESRRRELEALAEQLGVADRVTWLGHVDPLPVYHAGDVVILPSTVEGFGQTVVEGAMTGLLPIRSPSAGARDQIQDGETGFIIDPHDPEALAALLNELASHPERRRRVAEAARKDMAERFTIAALCDRTEAIYNTIVREHAAG